jgi:hypothetical protein
MRLLSTGSRAVSSSMAGCNNRGEGGRDRSCYAECLLSDVAACADLRKRARVKSKENQRPVRRKSAGKT